VVIKNISLREQVSELLLEKLCNGILRHGEKLNIAALAKELNVSATPMREALFGLSERGMIDFVNNKGFMLKSLTYKDAQEIYQITSMLENEALSSSKRIDEKTINQLYRLLSKLEQEVKGNRVNFKTISRFVNLIISHCGNNRLVEMLSELRYSTFQYEQLLLKSGMPLDNAFDAHREIIELMSQQKLKKAAGLLGKTWKDCLPLLKELFETGGCT
jgi:DNA-binding GntR family transcriptional regulator